jgi:hypothetical protein
MHLCSFKEDLYLTELLILLRDIILIWHTTL